MDEAALSTLARLASEAEIVRLHHRYCHAADSTDIEAFRSIFHPDSLTDHNGIFIGRSWDFADFALELFAREVPVTQHFVGNVLIEIDGDAASSNCYFLAYHFIPAAMSASVMTGHREGHDEIYWVGGRYIDRLSRRDGVWKISHRTAIHDWVRWEEVSDRGYRRPQELRGGKDIFALAGRGIPRGTFE